MRCIEEHLGNPTNYKLIDRVQACTLQRMLSREFGSWLSKYSTEVPEHKQHYLQTVRNIYVDKLNKFRATVKIHKPTDWENNQATPQSQVYFCLLWNLDQLLEQMVQPLPANANPLYPHLCQWTHPQLVLHYQMPATVGLPIHLGLKHHVQQH